MMTLRVHHLLRGKKIACSPFCTVDVLSLWPDLRTLLIMGSKAVLAAAKNKTDPVSRWAISVQVRRGYWKPVVAIAAKNARMCWAMLQRGDAFKLSA